MFWVKRDTPGSSDVVLPVDGGFTAGYLNNQPIGTR